MHILSLNIMGSQALITSLWGIPPVKGCFYVIRALVRALLLDLSFKLQILPLFSIIGGQGSPLNCNFQHFINTINQFMGASWISLPPFLEFVGAMHHQVCKCPHYFLYFGSLSLLLVFCFCYTKTCTTSSILATRTLHKKGSLWHGRMITTKVQGLPC